MLQVTFVHHSCFVVETDHAVLIFDYFPACEIHGFSFHGHLPVMDETKTWYIFASHSHQDHFSPEVLLLAKKHPQTRMHFIFSRDIHIRRTFFQEAGLSPSVKDQIRYVTPRSEYRIGDIRVETLRSTDEGVAFVVEADGLCIYHAGDLHLWSWGGRGSSYIELMTNSYQKEIAHLKNRAFDLAFVVLDPRLMDGSFSGLEYFLTHVQADLVFPMHLWQDWSLIPEAKKRPAIVPYRDHIVDIDRENLIFQIS